MLWNTPEIERGRFRFADGGIDHAGLTAATKPCCNVTVRCNTIAVQRSQFGLGFVALRSPCFSRSSSRSAPARRDQFDHARYDGFDVVAFVRRRGPPSSFEARHKTRQTGIHPPAIVIRNVSKRRPIALTPRIVVCALLSDHIRRPDGAFI